MPVLQGRGAIAKNISLVMSEFKITGKIGNIKPRTEQQAHKIAVTIAMDAEKRAKMKKKGR